jgi:hypothetical protein
MYRQDRDRASQLGPPSFGMPDAEVVRRDLSGAEVRARLAADACVILPGELVNVAEVEAADLAACKFSNESGFYIPIEEPEEPSPPPPKKKAPAMQTVTPTVEVIADAIPASAPTDLLSSIPLPGDGGIPALPASAQALVAAPADLKSVLPVGGDTNALTVIMAAIAVAGGGAAWKFYDSHSKRKHEEAMARIEKEPGEDAHKKCDASRAALELRVSELFAKIDAQNARLDEIHRAISAQRDSSLKLNSFDPESLEERLAKLEKASRKGKKS